MKKLFFNRKSYKKAIFLWEKAIFLKGINQKTIRICIFSCPGPQNLHFQLPFWLDFIGICIFSWHFGRNLHFQLVFLWKSYKKLCFCYFSSWFFYPKQCPCQKTLRILRICRPRAEGLNPEPWNLWPQPWILDPAPTPLNPKTLNHNPKTLNPKTLNPKPQTLNPKTIKP